VSLHGSNRRYIPPEATCEGCFLESELPLVAFATLTLPTRASRVRLDTSFDQWVQGVQAHNVRTIGWIRAYEPRPQLHAHVVLLSAGPVDCEQAVWLWMHVTGARSRGAAKVEPYQQGIGGLNYVLKSLGSDAEDIGFSQNLSAFVPHGDTRFFGLNAEERRHIRRIQAQAQANRKSARQPEISELV
jgi:hypothetical protein